MRRRTWDEIQGISQVPPGYQDQLNKNYSSLIPSYVHKSIYKLCDSDDLVYSEGPRIYYNDVYSYSDDSYHRDNYCMVPIKVPPMTLKSSAYNLNHSVVVSSIPKVSSIFGLEYDHTFLTSYSLADVVILAYPEYVHSLEHGCCRCNDNNMEVEPGGSYTGIEGPLDHMVSDVPAISDEYAYMWEDLWDMGTFHTSSGRGEVDESSSSSGISDGGVKVFLGRIKSPPTGPGGTVTVELITVSGSGGIKSTGKTVVVNIPAI